MINQVGFSDIQVKVLDYNLSSTPPIFYLNPEKLDDKIREKALREYNEAIEMIRKRGEVSPPIILIKAKK